MCNLRVHGLRGEWNFMKGACKDKFLNICINTRGSKFGDVAEVKAEGAREMAYREFMALVEAFQLPV